MPPKGKGFKQDWDAIDKINKDLVDLKEAVSTSAKRYASETQPKAEHYGNLTASANASAAAIASVKQITTALDDGAAYLEAFTAKTTAGVKQHQKSDAAAEDDYVNSEKDVS